MTLKGLKERKRQKERIIKKSLEEKLITLFFTRYSMCPLPLLLLVMANDFLGASLLWLTFTVSVFFLRSTKKKRTLKERSFGERGRGSPQKEQMNKRVDATERQATRRADAESNLDRHSSKRRLGQKKGRLGETTPKSKSGKQGEPLVRTLRQFQAKAAGS